MPRPSAKHRRTKHEPGQPNFVTTLTRSCNHCPKDNNAKPLKNFHCNASNLGVYYAPICSVCMALEAEGHPTGREVVAAETFVTGLTGIKNTRQVGVPFEELWDATADAFGGQESMFELGGVLCHKVIHRATKAGATPQQMDRAVKLFAKIMDIAVTNEKNKPPALDFRDMDEAQTAELMFEIIAANDGIRSRLFNDPSFRSLFMQESGVELFETEAVGAES